jgi:hypothetical protein
MMDDRAVDWRQEDLETRRGERADDQAFRAQQAIEGRAARLEELQLRLEDRALDRYERTAVQAEALELRKQLAEDRRELRQRDRQLTANDQIAAVEKMRGEVQGFMDSPGFSTVYGKSRYLSPRMLPGEKGADAEARRLQLEGASFGISVQQMRGLGQLSDAEGRKITQAYSRAIDPNQSEESAKVAWEEVMGYLDLAQQRAAARGGYTQQAPTAPAPGQQGQPVNETDELMGKYGG